MTSKKTSEPNAQEISAAITQRLSKIEHTLQQITPKALKEMQAEATCLHEQIQVMMLKLSVVTEVSRVARQFAPVKALHVQQVLIESLDKEDKWWKARAHWIIKEWIERIEQPKAA